jgi:hypothetical protein
MAIKEWAEYWIKQGYTVNQLRDILINYGYDVETVNKVLSELSVSENSYSEQRDVKKNGFHGHERMLIIVLILSVVFLLFGLLNTHLKGIGLDKLTVHNAPRLRQIKIPRIV